MDSSGFGRGHFVFWKRELYLKGHVGFGRGQTQDVGVCGER